MANLVQYYQYLDDSTQPIEKVAGKYIHVCRCKENVAHHICILRHILDR